MAGWTSRRRYSVSSTASSSVASTSEQGHGSFHWHSSGSSVTASSPATSYAPSCSASPISLSSPHGSADRIASRHRPSLSAGSGLLIRTTVEEDADSPELGTDDVLQFGSDEALEDSGPRPQELLPSPVLRSDVPTSETGAPVCSATRLGGSTSPVHPLQERVRHAPLSTSVAPQEQHLPPDTPYPAEPSREAPRPKLFAATRSRASSFGRQLTSLPKLPSERSETSETPAGPSRRKPFRKLLQLSGRVAQSAPTTPLQSPSPFPSTDRVHLFRSRPSSIVLTGNPSTSELRASFFFPAEGAAQTGHSRQSSIYTPALEYPTEIAAGTRLPLLIPLTADEDTFEDALPRNLFDALLPREIRQKIFQTVVSSSIASHTAAIASGKWSLERASDERWVGLAGGIRELVKLSRVCREWRDLAYDGQLWKDISISAGVGSLASFQPAGLVRLASHAGAFMRCLDLRGFAQLRSDHLNAITEGCIAWNGVTSLTSVNLAGCRGISTSALHYLLAHSPRVETLNLSALPVVVGATCSVIVTSAIKGLKHLDVSLCRHLMAPSLLELNQPSLERLYAASIPSMNDATAGQLFNRFPLLAVLDLGYSRHLTDAAFVPWPHADAGGTRTRHLRLSHCTRLTDATCANLLGKLPGLEILELASIGTSLRDGGVVKLLEECSSTLQKLDLEDATSLSDRIITALLPGQRNTGGIAPSSPLQHVNLTNMPELTEPALIRLVRAAPKLHTLECSSSPQVFDAFVRAFLLHAKRNRVAGAELGVVDCRGITRAAFGPPAIIGRDAVSVLGNVRPRRGVADWDNRIFEYVDGRGGSSVGGARGKAKASLAECDERKVVVHSFWTWQQLDEVEAAARTARIAQLAQDAGGPASPNVRIRIGGPLSPSLLRTARRASFALRGTAAGETGGEPGVAGSGSSCIIC